MEKNSEDHLTEVDLSMEKISGGNLRRGNFRVGGTLRRRNRENFWNSSDLTGREMGQGIDKCKHFPIHFGIPRLLRKTFSPDLKKLTAVSKRLSLC